MAEPPPPELLEQLGIEPHCTCDSADEPRPDCRGNAASKRGSPAAAQYLRNTPCLKEKLMRDIATATVSGNLTRGVEVRELPSGVEVARLRAPRPRAAATARSG